MIFRDLLKMPPFLWGLAPVLVLGPALTCIAPNIMIALYAICGTLGVAAQFLRDRRLPAPDRTLVYGIAGFVLYGCASQIWTIAPDHSFSKSLILGALFFLATLLLAYITAGDDALRRRAGMLAGIGLALGLAVYTFEDLNNFPLYDLVRGGNTHDVADLKQNKAAFMLSVWLYMAFPFFTKGASRPLRGAYAALPAGVYWATFTSESASAQIVPAGAPVLAVILFVLPTWLGLRLTLPTTALFSALGPLRAIGIFRHTDWQHSTVINYSLQSRIEIWDQSARRTMEKPLFGWGMDSARALPNRGEVGFMADGHGHHQKLAHLHPHNAPLQIWFEMGAVGMAGLCALFFLFYRRLAKNAAPLAQRFGMFMWATSFLYTLSIWGIWQSWFVATLCLIGVMTAAGVRHLDERTA